MSSIIENTESGNFNSPDVKLSWHGPDKGQREVYLGGGGEERERMVLKTKEMTLGIRESNLRKIIFSAKYQA